MKTFWSLSAKILLVVVIVQAWFLYDYYNKNQQLMAENVQIETELFEAKEALLAVEKKATELEKRSLEGMLKETNKAVVSGWEKLLDAVEGELDKARESIGELREPKASVENPSDLNNGSTSGSTSSDSPVPEVKTDNKFKDRIDSKDSELQQPEKAIPQSIQGERT